MSEQKLDFGVVTEFENKIAKFFGSPFAVATDSCTSSLELCLRLAKAKGMLCSKHTYLSVPMLANKLNIFLNWNDEEWEDYYMIYSNRSLEYCIYDAAVLWKENSYKKGTMMCISFQKQKHLSVGRLGVILTDNERHAIELKKMSYDGRLPNVPWRDQSISSFGYHYYAQPELCKIAIDKLDEAIKAEPRKWSIKDWPDISNMDVFKNKE